MNLWYLKDIIRFKEEYEAIEDLQNKNPWLSNVEWIFEKVNISVCAQIEVAEQSYSVKMIYPEFYPSVPPILQPKDTSERWSTHQYTGGTLCLEWGPDNWHSGLNGADMLISTYKLLCGETQAITLGDRGDVIESRHFLTLGQSLRQEIWRLFVTYDMKSILLDYPTHVKRRILVVGLYQKIGIIFHIKKIMRSDDMETENIRIPSGIRMLEYQGNVYRTSADIQKIKESNNLKEIEEIIYQADKLEPHLTEVVHNETKQIEEKKAEIILIVDNNDSSTLCAFYASDNCFWSIPIIIEDKPISRLADNLSILKNKNIGIVGVGSLGSKVAMSLARMGIGAMYLIDEDIFMPENIQRHILTWEYVGIHKVDALCNVIKMVNPSIKMETSNIKIGGQESTATYSNVLLNLSKCDLIIDATANPEVFNLLSMISSNNSKPMVWGEVFAGGIGGLVARCRPGIDPNPQIMRSYFLNITAEQPDNDLGQIEHDYTSTAQDGTVIIASDADIEVIAGHCTKLIMDTLVNSESEYDSSMYLIGLSRKWIFTRGVFETYPIPTDHIPIQDNTVKPNEADYNDAKDLLIRLIEQGND